MSLLSRVKFKSRAAKALGIGATAGLTMGLLQGKMLTSNQMIWTVALGAGVGYLLDQSLRKPSPGGLLLATVGTTYVAAKVMGMANVSSARRESSKAAYQRPLKVPPYP